MTLEYDPFSEDVIHGDHHAIYKRLRDEAPVYRLERFDAWALSRFEDVWWACEGDFVSSAQGATSAHLLTKVQPVLPLLNNMDPPEHTTLRAGLRRHFMPARVRALEPWIREQVCSLLEPFADGGEHEFVEDFRGQLAGAAHSLEGLGAMQLDRAVPQDGVVGGDCLVLVHTCPCSDTIGELRGVRA